MHISGSSARSGDQALESCRRRYFEAASGTQEVFSLSYLNPGADLRASFMVSLTAENGTATSFSPAPRNPPTPTIRAVVRPSGETSTSMISPILLSDGSYTVCLYQSVTVTLLFGRLDQILARPDDIGCAKAAVPAIRTPAEIAIRFFMTWPLWMVCVCGRKAACQPDHTTLQTRSEFRAKSNQNQRSLIRSPYGTPEPLRKFGMTEQSVLRGCKMVD